jgi:hypothetical protein
MSKRITTKTTTTTTPSCHQENRGQPKYRCDASGLCSSGRLPCPSHLRLQRGHTHTTLGQVLQKQRQEGMRELEGSQRRSGKRSPLCFKQTLIRYRIFRPTEACGSRNNLFVMTTCEHVNSTCPQSIGWDREPGGCGKSNLVVSGPAAPMDSGNGIASPGVECQGVPRPTQRTTKSQRGPPTSSPGQGPTPSTSMLTMPSDAPSTPSSTRASSSQAPLPSYACTTDAPCTHDIEASSIDCPGTRVSWHTAAGHEELEGTRVRSPAVATDSVGMGKCGGVTGHAMDRQTIGVVEVQLLPPNDHLLSSGIEIGEAGAT